MASTQILLKQCMLPLNKNDNAMDIFISNGIIQEISESFNQNKETTLNSDITIINAHNKFLLPGFIDSHVHLILNGSADIQNYVKNTSISKFLKLAEKHCLDSLKNGLTTLRDMGDFKFIIPKLKRDIISNKKIGPRLFTAGHMLTAKHGHITSIARQISDIEEGKEAIQEQVIGGVDFIKIIISGGLLTRNQHPLKTEMNHNLSSYLIKECQKNKLKCAVHAYSDSDIKTCVHNDVWSIEHGTWASLETLRTLGCKNIFFCPTIKAAYEIINHKDCLPKYMVKNAENVIQELQRLIPLIKENKILLIMGTDAGTPFNYHGSNLKEIDLLIEFGIPDKMAIESATINPAKMLGLDNKIGQIREGFFADLILWKKNPLDSISFLKNSIEYVILNGSIITR